MCAQIPVCNVCCVCTSHDSQVVVDAAGSIVVDKQRLISWLHEPCVMALSVDPTKQDSDLIVDEPYATGNLPNFAICLQSCGTGSQRFGAFASPYLHALPCKHCTIGCHGQSVEWVNGVGD